MTITAVSAVASRCFHPPSDGLPETPSGTRLSPGEEHGHKVYEAALGVRRRVLETDAVRPIGGAQLGAGDLRPDLVSVAVVRAVLDLGVQSDGHVVGGSLGEEGNDHAVHFDRNRSSWVGRVRRRTTDASK